MFASTAGWTFLGYSLQAALIGLADPPVGAAFGWLIGSALALRRSPDLLARDKQPLTGLLWGIIPVVTALVGVAILARLAIDWGIGAAWISRTAVADPVAEELSLLRTLPEVSLDSSLLALVACFGLLLGYGFGLMSLIPIIDVAPPNWHAMDLRSIAAFTRELAEEVLFRHAGLVGWPEHPNRSGSTSLLKGIMEMHWSTLMVLAAVLLLLICSAASLLLALMAAIGLAVG